MPIILKVLIETLQNSQGRHNSFPLDFDNNKKKSSGYIIPPPPPSHVVMIRVDTFIQAEKSLKRYGAFFCLAGKKLRLRTKNLLSSESGPTKYLERCID